MCAHNVLSNRNRKEISTLKAELEGAQATCKDYEEIKQENTKLSEQLNQISTELSTKTIELARVQKDYEPLKKVL